MNNTIGITIQNWLVSSGIGENTAGAIRAMIIISCILIISYLANYITKKFIISLITSIVKRSKNQWDDIFLDKKVFNRLSHFAPALIIYFTASIALPQQAEALAFIKGGMMIYMTFIGLLVIDSFINALQGIYETLPVSTNRPIKGYIQVVKIIINFIGAILIISILLGKSPATLFAGLGAMAAILLLVFKDTILGFVSSIQLSANNMVKPGDWISMPSHKADGTVIEISLNTVKVQNWNKTIATIPTYALISESFSNWKGMEDSGGRRIKRSINIDVKSIKLCTPELIEKLKNIKLLSEYIQNKTKELEQYNTKHNIDNSETINGRRLTNIGTFRKYLEKYLSSNSNISKEMTFLVRQLQATEKGLPIEIYVFCKEQSWVEYEGIQSDIFDHIFAVVSEFELKVFQNPTGDDFQKLTA